MASIWNDINLEWEGETITVRPTLDFINSLEQKQGSSLSLLIQRMQTNDMPMGISCHVIGTTLRAGGIKISDDELYSKVLELGPSLGQMVGTIVGSCLPMPKGAKEGKSQA